MIQFAGAQTNNENAVLGQFHGFCECASAEEASPTQSAKVKLTRTPNLYRSTGFHRTRMLTAMAIQWLAHVLEHGDPASINPGILPPLAEKESQNCKTTAFGSEMVWVFPRRYDFFRSLPQPFSRHVWQAIIVINAPTLGQKDHCRNCV